MDRGTTHGAQSPTRPPGMTMQQAAREALQVQDACNLSGVVLAFGRILTGPLSHLDTAARNRHPISKLFADKLRDAELLESMDD